MLTRVALGYRSALSRAAVCRRGYGGGTVKKASSGVIGQWRWGGLETTLGNLGLKLGSNWSLVRPVLCRGLTTEGRAPPFGEGQNEYEKEMLQKYLDATCVGQKDTMARREQVLALSRFLQEELGAGVEGAWEVLIRNNTGNVHKKTLASAPLDTIRRNVEYFKELGKSEQQILHLLDKRGSTYLFKMKAGLMPRKVKTLEKILGIKHKEAFDWILDRPGVLHSGNLERTLEFLLETMGMSKTTLLNLKCTSTLLNRSLEHCIKPRYEFLCFMEEKHGRLLKVKPHRYLLYSDRRFQQYLRVEFGNCAVREFEEYFSTKRVERMDFKIDLSDYETAMVDEFMLKQYSAGYDTPWRRERVLLLSRYLQELGAGVEESWDVLTKTGSGRRLAQSVTPETISGTVEYLKAGGWKASQILELFHKNPNTFKIRLETVARKMKSFEKALGLTREETFNWVFSRPKVLHSGDIEVKVEYLRGQMGISKETMMKDEVVLTLSLEGRIKPRFEFLRRMEARHGWGVPVKAQTYLRYSSARFDYLLAMEYGDSAVGEYAEFCKGSYFNKSWEREATESKS